MQMIEYLRQAATLSCPGLAESLDDYHHRVCQLHHYYWESPESLVRELMCEALELLAGALEGLIAVMMEEESPSFLGAFISQAEEAFDILASVEYEVEQARVLAA